MTAITSLQDRLAPAEKIFFTWLPRVVLAATLVACAWLDDAPPLELAAWIITGYVILRVISEFPNFMAAAPFENKILRILTAALAIVLLGFSFGVVAIFVERLAISVA